MATYDYDLFTIGAGSGGVRASRMASQYGARAAIAEEYRVGGTCVIRGCVPKKLFVYASHFSETFEDADGFGWSVGERQFDWPRLIANKDAEIDRLNKIYIRNLDAAGVEIFQSRAVLKDAHTVHLVAENRDVTAEHILISTGARPNLDPGIKGIEHAITSNEAFHLKRLPGRIVIAGAGYIAIEFAGIFNGLGVDTTVIYRRDAILRGFDDDLRHHLREEMEKKGVKFIFEDTIAEIEKSGDGLVAHTNGGQALDADQVMFAIGRAPNTDGLGLEKAGVEMTGNGAIKVDDYSRTNVDNISAVGDVTDRVALTPVAIREGAAFAETVFNANATTTDYSNIATAVFSQPEIGTVGLTEAEARKAHGDVVIYKSTFRPMKHTLSGRDEKMLMKLIVDAASDKVLGCHILGPDAGEMAQLLGISLKLGATKADFDATMAVHPTASEELVTMREPWTPPKAEAAE